jgi:hypothetical protein
MELLEVCLRTTYFQVGDKLLQQKDGMAMGSSLLPIVSNIYMEHFERLALDWAQHKPPLWFRYIDDTFVVWPHATEQIQTFLRNLTSLKPAIHFTMEIESDGAIPFLDVLDIRKETTLVTKVYRKPTNTGRYLSFNSNHPPHVKRGLIQSFHKRTSTICQEHQISVMKLVVSDAIFSRTVIPEVSLTRLLTGRAEVSFADSVFTLQMELAVGI